MSKRDASDVIYRNDYKTRYINYIEKQKNTIGAIYTINDGSGAANEASEVTYLTIGSTLVPNVELSNAPVVPSVVPTSVVETIYSGSPRASVATSSGVYIIDGSSSLYKVVDKIISSTVYPAPITSVASDLAENLFVTTSTAVYKNTSSGIVNMNITGLTNISGVTVNSNIFFFLQAGSSQIFSGTSNSAAVAVAGSTAGLLDGDGSLAQFTRPGGIALDPSSSILWIADTGNSIIRTMTTVFPYVVTVVAGNSVVFANANPTDNVGNKDGIGNIGETLLFYPQGINVSPSGAVYIADTNNNNIRLFANGYLSTFAGQSGTFPVYDISPAGYVDGPRSSALFSGPTSVSYYDSSLYITEPSNGTVRVITLV